MSSDLSYTIKANSDGTGTLEIKDPSLFRFILQAMTGQISVTKLVAVPQHLPSLFFRKLIDEINSAYSAGLYTSTYVCLRKLFENLLIELLRKKYGTSRIDLYYWSEKARFHDFSILIDNLSQNVADFRSYTSQFDQPFFTFIKNFKEQANRTAHSIDIIENPDDIEKMKSLVNQYCTLLCNVIRMI